jgi:hypothetical protein
LNSLTVKQYTKKDFTLWNNFVAEAKNATFLFHRDFMDYHQDRFEDASLMVFKGAQLVAVLPANSLGDVVYSHQGLTYGGFVFGDKMKLNLALKVFRATLFYLHDKKIKTFQIKMMPSIYFNSFSQEINYGLFIANASLIRRDTLSILDLQKEYKFSKDRRQCIRRGIKNNLEIREEINFELFWNEILIPNMNKKHQVKPVHSLEEIMLLQQKFPKNIRHFNVYQKDKIVAGTTIFVTPNVIHPQYISGNSAKNELGSLDFLYHHLITEVFKAYPYFDFGPSNENQGKNINEGLLFWKESFGTKTVIQDFYEVETANFGLLDTVML